METPTVVTTQLIIDHFKEDSAWHGKWLLVFERNIATFEKKVKRVWEAIGSEDASAVLAAIKCWTSARPKPQGLVIDKASGLMVYKLTQKSNPEDVYGTNATFIAFGYERPTKSVFDTYLNPDALRRPRVAVSGKRVSTSAPLADKAFEYSTKEINQAVADEFRGAKMARTSAAAAHAAAAHANRAPYAAWATGADAHWFSRPRGQVARGAGGHAAAAGVAADHSPMDFGPPHAEKLMLMGIRGGGGGGGLRLGGQSQADCDERGARGVVPGSWGCARPPHPPPRPSPRLLPRPPRSLRSTPPR
jgi:hypothetical protein